MYENGYWIINAKIVLPQKTVKGNVCIQKDIIKKIELHENTQDHSKDFNGYKVIDGEGLLLLPGLIDLHCDAIEKEVEPRPNTLFPMKLALVELEKKLSAAGITTMYHSLSLGVGLSVRGNHVMKQLIECIQNYRNDRSMIRHRIHLRYEITHFEGLNIAEKLVQNDQIDYFSYMNHAPGIGQYKRPGSFEKYVMKNQGINKEEVQAIIDSVLKKQTEIDWQALKQLSTLIISKGIRIASHDDDTIDQVEASCELGARISEFPLNLETAAYAKVQNLAVCVGAPNIIRGGSHDKNMKAIDAVHAGSVGILCSDYSPSTLLPAVYKLSQEGISLSEAVNMVTLHPAQALDLDRHYGSIEVGKKADLVLVEPLDDYPSIRKTMVDGKIVYQSDFMNRIP